MLIRRRMIQNLMLGGLIYRTRIYAYSVSSSSKIAKMKFSYFYTRKIHFIYFINEILV